MKYRNLLLSFALCVVGTTSAFALYSVSATGIWPKTWPQELEPLRPQSRTLVGPKLAFEHHAIPFESAQQFASAWPHLLKVKTPGAPIFLVRGPNFFLDKHLAGVVVHAPPAGQNDNPNTPAAPIAGINNPREKWMYTTYIEVVVDGKVIDLNQLPFPPDTPVVDERFPTPTQ